MFARTLLVAGTLVLALAGAAVAQTVVTGTVTRVDQPAAVVILQDGRMIQVPAGTVYVNGQPMALTTLQPGTPVTIQNGQVVMYQNGVYVASTGSPYEVTGRVVNIDRTNNVLVLEGMRPIALTPDMQVFQDGRQVALESLNLGRSVTVRSVSPIAFSDRNKTVAVAPAPATTIVTPAPAPSMVTPAPATTIVTPAPAVTPAPVVTTPGPVAYAGTVARVEPSGIVLTDGRLIPTTSQSVFLVNNQSVAMTSLLPGTQVIVYPNGQRAAAVVNPPIAAAPVVVTPAPATTTTHIITTEPSAAVPDGPIKVEGGLREYESTRNAP